MAGKESMDHGWWRMDFPRSETAGCVEIKLGQERWKMDGEIAVPLKGSGWRQERALTASAIHSTKGCNSQGNEQIAGEEDKIAKMILEIRRQSGGRPVVHLCL